MTTITRLGHSTKALFAILAVAFVSSTRAFLFSGRFSRHSRYQCHAKHATRQPQTSEKEISLLPEQNPYANNTATSLSGVRYSHVLNGLEAVFPPSELDRRTALSRTDGYFPFLREGKDPPQEFTYGEFDFYFFASLLDAAFDHYQTDPRNQNDSIGAARNTAPQDWTNKTFCDIGSGTGRLVFAAAALHPGWKVCRGIELLPGIHEAALEIQQRLATPGPENSQRLEQEPLTNHNDGSDRTDDIGDSRQTMKNDPILELPIPHSANNDNYNDEEHQSTSLPLAPVEFVCGSFEDPYVHFGDADIIFLFSTCLPKEGLANFAEAVGRQCKPGTIVITTDYMLPLEGFVRPVPGDDRIPSGNFKFTLQEQIQGWVWLTGGASTAFIQRVEQSAWDPEHTGPWERPEIPLEEKAYQAIQALEKIDSERFLRSVYNDIIFSGLPEQFARFYPRWMERKEQEEVE